MKPLCVVVFSVLAGGPSLGRGQAPPAGSPNRVAGTVTAVDPSAKQISVKTDQGTAVNVTVSDRTLLLHIPPGETDPKKGAKIALSDISAGDRIVATSQQEADQKPFEARAVLVSTKADLAAIQKKEQDDWQRRGTAGTVSAVDAAAKSFAIKVGQRTWTVQPSEKTDFHRYSPDSARFADAKPGSLGEVRMGDQARVLGDKTEDGATIKAEKVVFGTFRQLAATIKSVNAQTGEMVVNDLASKKPLTIKVNGDSVMRRLEPQMAAMLARRYNPSAPAGGESGRRGGSNAQMRPEGQGAPGGGMRGMRGGGSEIGQMLDRLPAMPLAELKPGDAIMVSTTQGSDSGRVTAINVLAGVEPLLTASPTATRDIMSGWNLGGGGGEGNQ